MKELLKQLKSNNCRIEHFAKMAIIQIVEELLGDDCCGKVIIDKSVPSVLNTPIEEPKKVGRPKKNAEKES